MRLDSLDGLRRELVRANEARPKYGIPMIDRFFRYEPVAPYNQNRGYQFLHAVAASMARNQKSSSSTGGPLQTLIEIGAGKDFDFGKWRIGINGVIDLLAAKNSIDGQWFGYGILVARKLGEGRSIRLRSSINYALKSRNWYHEHNLLLYYAPQLNGLMVLSGGHTSRETFHLTPEEIYRGYYGALPAANSPVVSFVKDYLQLRNRIQLTESLDLSTSLLFEDRKPQVGIPLEHHRALLASGQVLWAPSFLNRSESGIPIPIGHRRELGVIYKQAFDPNGSTQSASAVPYSRFQQLEAFVRGTIPLNEDNKIDLKINAGTYLSREYLSPSDEKYFALAPVIDRTPFKDNWATLPPFFTGGKSWTTQEVNFYSNKFLLRGLLPYGRCAPRPQPPHRRRPCLQRGRLLHRLGRHGTLWSLRWV